jgi:hypothetical protein
MKLFQLIVFGGTVALLIPFLEKGEGRAAAILGFLAAYSATWVVVWIADFFRYRS